MPGQPSGRCVRNIKNNVSRRQKNKQAKKKERNHQKLFQTAEDIQKLITQFISVMFPI